MISKIIYNKKRGIAALLTIIVFSFCLNFSLLAASDSRVFDQADLFSADEISMLEESIANAKENYPADIVIVTTNDNEGKSDQDYADDFYDEHAFGYDDSEDGILLLIDMDSRNLYISTAGEMIRYFTDDRINDMLDHIAPYLTAKNYYGGAICFIDDVKSYIDEGIPRGQYTTNSEFHYKHQPFKNKYGNPIGAQNIFLSCLACSFVSFIIVLIVRAFIIHSYKHPRLTIPPTVPDNSSVHYTQKEDHFVTSHTSRVKMESSSGGSHSSSHRSSGGHSHGGGGRGF